jgi:hypothetical protein
MQPEQRIALARDEPEARPHDSRQYEHAAAAWIAARGRELGELRQFPVFRLAEVCGQQRRMGAGAQQRDDLVVVQVADAGNARFGHYALKWPSTSGLRRTPP